MLTTQTMNAGFDLDLKSILPRLRVYAMSLTRDIDRATSWSSRPRSRR